MNKKRVRQPLLDEKLGKEVLHAFELTAGTSEGHARDTPSFRVCSWDNAAAWTREAVVRRWAKEVLLN
jgi:hypothetical protein